MSPVIGLSIDDLDSPALVLDAAAVERNLRRMADFFRDKRCRLRPHFKSHKCTTLARKQLAAGSAAGITCAKLGEAEVLAAAGIQDLLIANQVVGPRKVARLVELAKKAEVKVAVDHVDQIDALSRAAATAGVSVGVLVEVDIGMGRCGVPAGEPAWELAREAFRRPGLRFEGIQAYEGHAVFIDDFPERAAKTRQAMEPAIATRRMIESRGIPVRIFSSGSTSTYRITGLIDGVDEIQAGSYPTMDWRYAQVAPEFEVALSVLVRVISKRPGAAVLDVGVKGAGAEFGPPQIRDWPEVEIPRFLSEEHCVVHRAPDWPIGQPLRLVPSHGCTTCNLYREMYVCRDGVVEDVWPIEGAGKLQ